MAIVREKEFTINLGDIVKTRLESFVNTTKNIRAREEAAFQRRVIDNDLSYNEQLAYKQKQLEREQKRDFPDYDFIDEIKKEIVDLRKLSRQRAFRDGYFNFLQELSEGKKSLEDHLTFLENEVTYGGLDRESKDKLQDRILEIKEGIKTRNKDIFDSQIEFLEKDKTKASYDKAINALRSKINELEVQKSPELLNAYQLKMQAFEKDLREIEAEDKINNLYVSLLKSKSDYPSLEKVDNFTNFLNSSSNLPINVGGVRYESEREYWEATLNDYLQTKFATEFSQEINKRYSGIYTKLGQLPNNYLDEFKSRINDIRNNPIISAFPSVVLGAVQGASATIVDLKTKEIILKYGLDRDYIGVSDYNKSIQDYKALQNYFGADFSVTPETLSLENRLIEYKYKLAGSLQEQAQQAVDAGQFSTIEEAIKTLGPLTELEVAKEVYAEKSITDIALEEQRKVKEISLPSIPTPTPAPAPEVPPEEPPPIGVTPPVGEKPKYVQVITPAGLTASYPADKTLPMGYKLAPTPAPTPVAPKTVTVKSGETLSAIALRELGSAARWKELKTPEGTAFTEETAKRLQVGTKLVIPPK